MIYLKLMNKFGEATQPSTFQGKQRLYDDVHLIDTSLTDLESSVAGKLLQYVHRTRCASLAIYKRLSTMRLRITCRCPMRSKVKFGFVENARTGKKHGSSFSGS